MTDSVNTRELILGILMEVTKEGSYSHLVIRSVLDKYQYLEKKERAFITRVSEGTIQYMIELDYIINQFSKVKVNKIRREKKRSMQETMQIPSYSRHSRHWIRLEQTLMQMIKLK